MQTLEELMRSRVVEERIRSFALSLLENYSVVSKAGETINEFYTRPYSDEKPYATTGTERRQFISSYTPYWYGAGAVAVVLWPNKEIDVVGLYRNIYAPSWPNSYNIPSGLPNLIEGKQEKIISTIKRELSEEIIFVDHNRVEYSSPFKDLMILLSKCEPSIETS